ncbi:MAG: hypothetical protein LBT40_03615 [Deltaproteobacteria bacterium]|nr:hypothetical protein [Deltaproteobacteria bacterium]
MNDGRRESGFREPCFSGPARAGGLSGTSGSARGFNVRVGEVSPDAPEWAKRIAGPARRPGVPAFTGDASLSADHEQLTGDTSRVIGSIAAEGLFSLAARIDLTGTGRPPGDLAFGLPPAGEGGNASLRARIPASPGVPEYRRQGRVRGLHGAGPRPQGNLRLGRGSVPGRGDTRNAGDGVARGQVPGGGGAQPRLPGQDCRPGHGTRSLHLS